MRDPVGDLVMHVFRINDVATDVESLKSPTPEAPWIRCGPNPFTAATEIAFGLPHAGEITIRVYDQLGREVAVLVEGRMQAGTHVAEFNPRRLGLGASKYVAVVNGGGIAQSAAMIFTK